MYKQNITLIETTQKGALYQQVHSQLFLRKGMLTFRLRCTLEENINHNVPTNVIARNALARAFDVK